MFLPRNNSPLAFEGIPSLVVAGAAVSALSTRCCLFSLHKLLIAAGSPDGVQEVRLQFSPWAGITYRLHPGVEHVDMVLLFLPLCCLSILMRACSFTL